MSEPPLDFDMPWKAVIERFFELFLAFFFPELHADIDWSRGFTFLDTELQQITRDAELGRRLADKLVRVWMRDGEDLWLLVHVEVQAQEEPGFARRIYIYNHRIFDSYDHEVVSLAILADERPGWRPSAFGYRRYGFRSEIEFPIVKLLDYRARRAELMLSRNPFAILVLAHLQAQATRRDPTARFGSKTWLVRALYDLGLDRQDILELFRFIDWLLVLPEELERSFRAELQSWEEERMKPYITSIERLGREDGLKEGIQRGRQEGLQQGLLAVLEARFDEVPQEIVDKVRTIEDSARLEALHREAVNAGSIAEFAAALGGPGEAP
jgi:hypothetical protein